MKAAAALLAGSIAVASGQAQGVCDIFGAAGTPCVAAHALTRALYAAYAGPLYQVLRSSDNMTIDITVLVPGGTANTAPQDAFCAGQKSCVVQRIYDQVGDSACCCVLAHCVSQGSSSSSTSR